MYGVHFWLATESHTKAMCIRGQSLSLGERRLLSHQSSVLPAVMRMWVSAIGESFHHLYSGFSHQSQQQAQIGKTRGHGSHAPCRQADDACTPFPPEPAWRVEALAIGCAGVEDTKMGDFCCRDATAPFLDPRALIDKAGLVPTMCRSLDGRGRLIAVM